MDMDGIGAYGLGTQLPPSLIAPDPIRISADMLVRWYLGISLPFAWPDLGDLLEEELGSIYA